VERRGRAYSSFLDHIFDTMAARYLRKEAATQVADAVTIDTCIGLFSSAQYVELRFFARENVGPRCFSPSSVDQRSHSTNTMSTTLIQDLTSIALRVGGTTAVGGAYLLCSSDRVTKRTPDMSTGPLARSMVG
jgi:hypothetical protein